MAERVSIRASWAGARAWGVLAWAGVHSFSLFDFLPGTRWYHQMAEDLLDAMGPTPSDHLIDLGCGTGRHALMAGRRAGRVTGVDRSARMLQRAERNRRAEGANHVQFLRGDVCAIPMLEDSVSMATGFMLLPVLADPRSALEEAGRVVRPGGKVGLLVPSKALNPETAWAYCERESLHGLDRDTLIAWSRAGRGFDEPALRTLLEGPRRRNIQILPLMEGLAYAALFTCHKG
ncbi:MAG TPA: class I SAM-dependent methyltransferase [Holophagaceae bacterium]|jgi:SAM-dependent methyltransferase|nr:class I SAM-dependent methyltransferase [Holophagaceae bacterium]